VITEQKRTVLLALMSVAASLSVAIIIIGLSYQTAINNTYLRLQEVVQSQARLIESMIEYERVANYDQDPTEDVLVAVKAAHESYKGFGETGEFALASLEEGQIKFQVQQRVHLTAPSTFTASEVEWAEPMKRALSGESGTVLARDYRGEVVLAAFEAVHGSNLGLVAKIDRREIVNRFIPAAVGSVSIAVIVAIVSVYLFIRLGDPIVQLLHQQKKELGSSLENQTSIASTLRYREEQQRAIAELGADVLHGISLDDLLARIVVTAADFLRMDFAKVLLVQPDSDELLLRAGVGYGDGLVGRATVPVVDGSQVAFVLQSEDPVVVPDQSNERRFPRPDLWNQHGVRSGICVTIGSTEKPWGILGVHAKSCRDFCEADISFLQSLANLLNSAVKRSTSDAELRQWNILFRHAHWGMAITEASSEKYIAVNPAFSEMHGYTTDETLSKSVGAYIEPGQEEMIREWRGVVMEKDSATCEMMRVRKDGSVFPAIVHMVAIRDDQETEVYRVANIQDISEQKRAEKERLAVERKVQHAQKLESLGVLAGGIAHDFNNILMIILGNASVALQELGPDLPARVSVTAIKTAARRAAGLTKQMLAYSGKGQFVIEELEINKLVEEIAPLLDVALAKNVRLNYSLGEDLPLMRGDASQMGQILMNLIINASEAIGESTGEIQIDTGVMECDREILDSAVLESDAGFELPLPEGLYNYFLVSDTGCGMDSKTVARIFDPFFTTKFTGRGLGLAAMLGIIRAHRGAIKIHSEVGKGSSFKVMLPAIAGGGEKKSSEDQSARKRSQWRGSGVVLIADDDKSIVTLGKRMLGRLGYSPLAASDGLGAVEAYRKHIDEIVCVILDLTMPRMNGADAFQEIARMNPNAKIILCSGYDEKQVTGEFAGKGLAGFLQKPYTINELKKKMREVIA